jgi:hypothetical protein
LAIKQVWFCLLLGFHRKNNKCNDHCFIICFLSKLYLLIIVKINWKTRLYWMFNSEWCLQSTCITFYSFCSLLCVCHGLCLLYISFRFLLILTFKRSSRRSPSCSSATRLTSSSTTALTSRTQIFGWVSSFFKPIQSD